MAGVRHVVAPPPNRRPTHLPPDPARASEMLVDENQRMADEKRRAKLAQRMQERSIHRALSFVMHSVFHRAVPLIVNLKVSLCSRCGGQL